MSTFTKQLIHTAAIALIAAACTQTDDDTPQGRAISFRPAAETRAAVDADKKGMTDFLVWGGYTGQQLFEGETVHPSGSYEGGTRYWVPGEWNFYAIHPEAALDGKVAFDNGTFTVTGFDASATGDNAVDLMTATTPITYSESEGSNPPTSVGLAFHHELARVSFTIKAEGANVTVNKFKVFGLNYKGTFVQGYTPEWTQTTSNTQEDNIFLKENFIITPQEPSNAFGDILILPSNDITDAQLYVSYRHTGETTDRSAFANLKVDGYIENWIKGQKYNYTLTLKADGILFGGLTADKWEETSSGGNIPIQ